MDKIQKSYETMDRLAKLVQDAPRKLASAQKLAADQKLAIQKIAIQKMEEE